MEDGTVYRGFGFGAAADSGRRDRLQHRHHRLPRGADRSVVPRADRHHDGARDRQRRHQPRWTSSRRAPWCAGFVVRELSPLVSNWRARTRCDALLAEHGVAGITGIDTRAITRRIRVPGAQRAVITPRRSTTPPAAVAEARSHPSLEGRDLVREVTARRGLRVGRAGLGGTGAAGRAATRRRRPCSYHVVAYDFGIKRGILRRLRRRRAAGSRVVPAATPRRGGAGAQARRHLPVERPRRSGGGRLRRRGGARAAARRKLPVFGICLGHQILGLALGGKTYKLKFGHHGANQPVMDLAHAQGGDHLAEPRLRRRRRVDAGAGRADARQPERQDGRGDAAQRRCPVFSVQYHPEASPGPNDANYLFDRFVTLMSERRRLGLGR